MKFKALLFCTFPVVPSCLLVLSSDAPIQVIIQGSIGQCQWERRVCMWTIQAAHWSHFSKVARQRLVWKIVSISIKYDNVIFLPFSSVGLNFFAGPTPSRSRWLFASRTSNVDSFWITRRFTNYRYCWQKWHKYSLCDECQFLRQLKTAKSEPLRHVSTISQSADIYKL